MEDKIADFVFRSEMKPSHCMWSSRLDEQPSKADDVGKQYRFLVSEKGEPR